jgi:hypothetical protein
VEEEEEEEVDEVDGLAGTCTGIAFCGVSFNLVKCDDQAVVPCTHPISTKRETMSSCFSPRFPGVTPTCSAFFTIDLRSWRTSVDFSFLFKNFTKVDCTTLPDPAFVDCKLSMNGTVQCENQVRSFSGIGVLRVGIPCFLRKVSGL